ncbi:MAG: recombinase family protein [Clostridia bacterium]|nr:recombinase family protein [Clostridia bacterium]MBS6554411.1 recombinase family protein [Clostridium sp.]
MKIRVAVYCRVSTKSEMQQHRLGAQREYYEKLISSSDKYTLAGIYTDIASGVSKKGRTAFNSLLKACKKKKIDLILTKSISRFARNTLDFLQTIRDLKDWGVDVYFESEQILLSEERSELKMGIYEAVMQEESMSRSRITKWGLSTRFALGESKLANRVCYGYKHDKDGNLTIDEEKAENVKLIFHLYLQGYSLSGISKELKRRGILTPTGKEIWTSLAIDKILCNEKYTGNVLLQKTYVPDVLKREQKQNTGEKEKYLYENNHIWMISAEVFEAVQEERKRRSNLTMNEKGESIRKDKRYSSKDTLKEKGEDYR